MTSMLNLLFVWCKRENIKYKQENDNVILANVRQTKRSQTKYCGAVLMFLFYYDIMMKSNVYNSFESSFPVQFKIQVHSTSPRPIETRPRTERPRKD